MIKVYILKNTINNNKLDEVNKIINDYLSTHNKNFDFHFIDCEFVIEFDNYFIANIQTIYFYNTDIIKINSYLFYDINCFKSRGHKFYNINQMTINIIGDRCNMTYEHYVNQSTHTCERKLNVNIARNPHLINSLDLNKRHPLIRKYLHIPSKNKQMYITNITDDYDNLTLCNCTNNDNNDTNVEIIINFFTKIPCGISLICLKSLMVYTLIKPLFNKKYCHYLCPRKIYSNKLCFIKMCWRCDICDKIIHGEVRNNHLRSGYHKRLANSIIRRYIVTNLKPDKIDDTIRKYLRLH